MSFFVDDSNPRNPQLKLVPVVGTAVGVFSLIFIIIPLLFGSFFTIDSGERGIILTNGSVTSVADDGLHFKVPLIQKVVKVDVRTRKAHAPADAASADMQRVSSEVALNYHLDESKLAQIYTKSGMNVEANLIDPRIQEVVKAVVAKYKAEYLLSQREGVKAEIELALRYWLSP